MRVCMYVHVYIFIYIYIYTYIYIYIYGRAPRKFGSRFEQDVTSLVQVYRQTAQGFSGKRFGWRADNWKAEASANDGKINGKRQFSSRNVRTRCLSESGNMCIWKRKVETQVAKKVIKCECRFYWQSSPSCYAIAILLCSSTLWAQVCWHTKVQVHRQTMAQMHWQTKHMERFLGRERRERGEEGREEGREGKEARVGREGGKGREREVEQNSGTRAKRQTSKHGMANGLESVLANGLKVKRQTKTILGPSISANGVKALEI